MSELLCTELPGRKLLRISGEDAPRFLHGLVTCDVEHLKPGEIAFGALLSPQGKILFDFFIVRSVNGFILDTDASMADDLARRLTFYKLRAKVDIAPMDERAHVFAIWGGDAPDAIVADGVVAFDPRLKDMGARAYVRRAPPDTKEVPLSDWHRHRIELGMPEGGLDFVFGDAFPHEALMDQFKGVDFAKGCYVGQEVVSRMQHRGTARKRLIKATSDATLPESGTEILVGGTACGTLASTYALAGLAMVRLDRAADHATGTPAYAGTVEVRLTIPAWAGFGWPEAG